MNLINTDIKPDPFDPHRGDVYESGGPFPQRIVVEIPPTSEDQRIRYRVDGGADSNLTTLGQFHLHLAGLGEIRGVGRVREHSPASPDEIRSLTHQLRITALGVDAVAGDLMRGAAATIVEQAAVIARAHEAVLEGLEIEAALADELAKARAVAPDFTLLALVKSLRDDAHAFADKIGQMHERFLVYERVLVMFGLPLGEDLNEELASRVHYELVSNRKHSDQGYQAELNHRLSLQKSLAEMRDGLLEAEQKIRKEPLAYNDSTEPLAVARRIADAVASQQGAGELLVNTTWRLSALIDAVVGSGTKDPRSDANLIRIATNARQVSDQVRSAMRLLGVEWDDSKADVGHALIEAVRAERKFASDLALELDSISAFIAPHGVAMPAGAAKPTSLALVRWLAVTGGVVPHACHPTLAEVQEAQEVDFKARWDRYESAKRKPAIHEPARPEVGEIDHYPSVEEARALRLRAEVQRTVTHLQAISHQNAWPVRERLQGAAAVMLEVFSAVTAQATPRSSHSPIYCTGFVTVLAVKDRQIVQRQSWTSDRPDFKATDVSFHDDDARFTVADGMGQRALELGDRQGTWTWRGAMGSFPDKQQWQGEWTEETP